MNYNKQNELIKYEYAKMLEHAKGRSQTTVNTFYKAINEYEKFTKLECFKNFNKAKAMAFKDYLANKTNKLSGKPISKSYLRQYTSSVREFFKYLATHKSYTKHININDTNYLYLTTKDRRKASVVNYQESHSISNLYKTFYSMPNNTLIQQRNKAMFALAVLTTPRISALQSVRLKSIKHNKANNTYCLYQDPNVVNTKNSSLITSYFIGNNQDLYNCVLNWKSYLTSKGFKPNDYLFPRLDNKFNANNTSEINLSKNPIKSNSTIREIFKQAFHNNNLKYINPHSLRHSFTRYVLENNLTIYVSLLSQNLGCKFGEVLIDSYGTYPEHERAIRLKGFEVGGECKEELE